MSTLDREAPTGRLPPLVPGPFLVGSAQPLLQDPLAFFFAQYQAHGPVYRVRAAGRAYTILGGLDANRFFADRSAEVFAGQPIYRPYMDDTGSDHVLVAMEGEAHQAWRRTLQPAFSRDKLAPRFGAMVASMRTRIAALPANADAPLLDLMQDLVSNASGVAMVGCPVGKLLGATSRFAHTMLGAGVGGFPGFFRYLPRYRLARTQVFQFLRGVIAARRDRPQTEESPPLLEALLAARRADGEPLSEEDLLANLHIAFTNSLVYVGAISGFFLHFLLRNPRALEACRAEADQIFGGDALDLGRLQRSPWLRASLTETQRLQPISLSAPRAVREPFTFAGYDFAPGTMTLTATAITHLLPEYFPEPERFDPERCMAPRNEHRRPYAFVPFGLDNHACPAAGLVGALAMTAVGLLLHHLDLEPLASDAPLRLQIAPFPAPHRDHRFRVRAHRTGLAHSRPLALAASA
jgi:cytochrome P450